MGGLQQVKTIFVHSVNTTVPTILSILSRCVALNAVAAQQRLRRCIPLGGACGATTFSPAAPAHQKYFRGAA